MAAVSVFVDDAIRGELPLVCAKTGQPADVLVRSQQPVAGRLGPAWILVVFGPPGWLALLLLALVRPGPEYLTVRLPESNAAWHRERSLVRLRLTAFAVGVVTLACGVLRPGPFPLLWLTLGGGLLLAGLVLHTVIYFEAVGVSIDVSRRWVTLSSVHPAFVEAVERRQAPVRRA